MFIIDDLEHNACMMFFKYELAKYFNKTSLLNYYQSICQETWCKKDGMPLNHKDKWRDLYLYHIIWSW